MATTKANSDQHVIFAWRGVNVAVVSWAMTLCVGAMEVRRRVRLRCIVQDCGRSSMRHRANALCAAAAMLSSVVMAQASRVDTAATVAAADPVQPTFPQMQASVNPQDFSCKDLKDKLAGAGSLTILAGPRGYGDTFYGPRVPQCQFWQRPTFSYVRTRDSLCGVGYICVDKLGAAGGGR